MSIRNNIERVRARIVEATRLCGRRSEEITLLVVSKEASIDEIEQAYACGIRDFGENRLQCAYEKMEQLPKDIRWHFIGRLQKSKIPKVVGQFALIHSIEDRHSLEKVAKLSWERGVITPVLLEVNTSGELSKGGLRADEMFSHGYLQLLFVGQTACGHTQDMR